MARPRIVVVFGPRSLGQHWSSAAAEVLDSFAERVAVHLGTDLTSDERAAQVDGALVDADGLLLCGWGSQGIGYLSAERLAKAPRLRYIGSTCHYRQAEFCDVSAALARGIAFSETAPVMSPWVAEYELALGLAALRNLPQEHQIVGANGWVNWEDFPERPETPDRLQGRRVGLAGFGEIHRHLARMLAPFDTDWEAFDPYVPAERMATAGGRKATDLVAMAARSEVFFVAIPPTPETIEIINRDVIFALPHEAVFVLVSRMAVVEQAPLLERLTAGELRAALTCIARSHRHRTARSARCPTWSIRRTGAATRMARTGASSSGSAKTRAGTSRGNRCATPCDRSWSLSLPTRTAPEACVS